MKCMENIWPKSSFLWDVFFICGSYTSLFQFTPYINWKYLMPKCLSHIYFSKLNFISNISSFVKKNKIPISPLSPHVMSICILLAKLSFWSLNYLISISLVPWLKFDLFWSFNFSPLYILVFSVSFNSKTLGFLHFLLGFFWDSCCWMLMEMIWRWKREEEDEENLTFLN